MIYSTRTPKALANARRTPDEGMDSLRSYLDMAIALISAKSPSLRIFRPAALRAFLRLHDHDQGHMIRVRPYI